MRSFKYTLALATLNLILPAAIVAAQTTVAPSTGDLHPSYKFEPTGETMSYRLYVPAGYDGKRAMPLVVLLHGAGSDENRVFHDDEGPKLRKLADQHGFIILAPKGYAGGYGNIYPVVVTRETQARSNNAKGGGPPANTTPPGAPPPVIQEAVAVDDYAEQPAGELSETHKSQLSEQEVLAAIADVRKTYKIDSSRLYLSGNSMGGVGTAYLAAKYPTMWAAVAPGGGPVAAWSYPFERLHDNKVPALFVHGEFDQHANPHWSEALFNSAKAQGVNAKLLIVKSGQHETAWADALPQIFDFFDAHHR